MNQVSPQLEPYLPPEKPRSGWQELFSTLGILIVALLTALFIITFVFRSYQVDGASMETTLQNGDKLIIWKVPRTWARITNHDYIPKRGDVVVFDQAGLGEYGQDDKKQIIKRVVGLPGERVVVRDGTVTVYNKDNLGGFNPDRESYGQRIDRTSGNEDVTLSADEVFVLGDNRADSLDSRSFGPVNADQIVGKLVLRVLPLHNTDFY